MCPRGGSLGRGRAERGDGSRRRAVRYGCVASSRSAREEQFGAIPGAPWWVWVRARRVAGQVAGASVRTHHRQGARIRGGRREMKSWQFRN